MAIRIAETLIESAAPPVPRVYAWTVVALTFGLLLSDYMSRQVLNAVFPIIKTQWSLSDTQLSSLSGGVALLTGGDRRRHAAGGQPHFGAHPGRIADGARRRRIPDAGYSTIDLLRKNGWLPILRT